AHLYGVFTHHFVFQCACSHRHLHSFPTRRSSDLFPSASLTARFPGTGTGTCPPMRRRRRGSGWRREVRRPMQSRQAETPAGRAWTESQEQAITVRGKDILVSAAAGAGKTSVLVERIVRRLLDPERPVDIDRLLV